MRRSRTAPSRANKPAPAPSATSPGGSTGGSTEGAPSGGPHHEPAAPTIPLLFETAEGVRAFHKAARDALLDLAAAAREGARRPRKRILSRAEIRRQAREGYAEVASLLDLAAQGLEAHCVGGSPSA